MNKAFSVLMVLVSLTGCTSVGSALSDVEQGVSDVVIGGVSDSDSYTPPHVYYEGGLESSGSLYSGRSSMTLYNDRRAYRVGDILTVTLSEKTESKKSASSGFSKGSSAAFGVPQIGAKSFGNLSGSANADRSFDGSSKANQGNSLRGSITVTIHEVYPNGVLRVMGEKWIKLNQGDEYIRLSGNIRADDIEANNKVSSERIADAKITYAGKGTLANSTEPGWMTKILNSKWMPF